MDSISDALLQLKDGSGQLLAGSEDLRDGIDSASDGCTQLLSGSEQLVDADTQISDGASKLTSGIGIAGQKAEIEAAINKIKDNKDVNVEEAFSKTFLLTAVMLMAVSVCGLFTDKKNKTE